MNSKILEDAVKNCNLIAIYSVFYTILHEDPGFFTGKFRSTFDYVRSREIPGFIQPYDGEPFAPPEEWDQDYWAMTASDLVDNFCIERIMHLEEVGKQLYPSVPKKIQQEQVKKKCQSKRRMRW